MSLRAATILIGFFCAAPAVADELGELLSSGATSSANVMRVQQLLTENGYDPGPADGMLGSKTRTAVQEWKRATERPVDPKWLAVRRTAGKGRRVKLDQRELHCPLRVSEIYCGEGGCSGSGAELSCAGKQVALQTDAIEGGWIATKNYGRIQVRNEGRGVSLWLTTDQMARFRRDFGQ